MILLEKLKKGKMAMDWKIRDGAEPQGSGAGFWYDIGDGGYIEPYKVLEDNKDIKTVLDAIMVLRYFESLLNANGLMNEF